MSLTQQIENKSSPVRQWMDSRLDDRSAKDFVREVNNQLVGIPPIVVVDADPSLVGTAFDYGFRWLLGPMDRECAANQGACILDMLRNPDILVGKDTQDTKRESAASHVIHMSEELARTIMLRVMDAGDTTTDPRVRAQCCIVLAWFEQVYRAGPRVLKPGHGLYAIRSKPFVNAPLQTVLDTTPEASVADVMALLDTVPEVWGDDFHQPFILNPSFVSSNLVGAADADWITTQTIYDCKCTRKPRPLGREHLLQLLGYVLLDSDDAYTIRFAGWYYARQRKRIVYPLAELTDRVFGTTNLADLRDSFQKTLREYLVASIGKVLGSNRSGG